MLQSHYYTSLARDAVTAVLVACTSITFMFHLHRITLPMSTTVSMLFEIVSEN